MPDIRAYEVRAVTTDTFGRVLLSCRDQHLVVDGPAQNGCPGEAITPAELFLSAYGWVLTFKLSLFAGMGLLALSNRFQLTPALAAGADPQRWQARLRLQVSLEFALGILVLAVVGALGAMSPPASQ